MQHILYIVFCTKKVFSLFVFKIMTFTIFGLLGRTRTQVAAGLVQAPPRTLYI